MLITAGADVNAKITGGYTALMLASQKGYLEIVKLLITAGADVNAKITGGYTALMLASQKGYLEIVKVLIAARADVNAKDKNGATALKQAQDWGRQEVVKTLIAFAGEKGRARAKEKARDGRFIAYDNGTVLDTKTNLMWAAKDNGDWIDWCQSICYCENYLGGDYTDWRMPTSHELAGLHDEDKKRRPACVSSKVTGLYIDMHVATKLIDITCGAVWTSETDESKTYEDVHPFYAINIGNSTATYYNFSDGNRWIQEDRLVKMRALPVRSGSVRTGTTTDNKCKECRDKDYEQRVKKEAEADLIRDEIKKYRKTTNHVVSETLRGYINTYKRKYAILYDKDPSDAEIIYKIKERLDSGN